MELDKNHHAFLLQASSLGSSGLPEELLKKGVDTEHIKQPSFGIDEARDLTHKASQKAVELDHRSFVIFTESMTLQAQNALLKLFEEPPSGVVFVLVMPDLSSLIPTLLSRMIMLTAVNEKQSVEIFTDFVALPVAEQLALVTDKTKAKDGAWIKAIVKGALNKVSGLGDKEMLESVVLVSEKINGPGASKKMLLEELVLSLNSCATMRR